MHSEKTTSLHSLTLILPAMLVMLVMPTAVSIYGQTHPTIEQLGLQIQEIDNSIRVLEAELGESTLKIDQINMDSVRIISENQKVLSELQGKISQIDEQISVKNTEIAANKAQRTSSVNDSARAVQAFVTERSSIVAKIKQLESLIQSGKNEIATLAKRREQLYQFSLQQSDPQGVQLQAEKQNADNTLITKQKSLESLYLRKTELTNDSAAQITQLQASIAEENKVLAQSEGEMQVAEASVASAKNTLGQAQAIHADKKSRTNGQIQQLLSRKASVAAATTQSMSRLKQMETDLSKLAASAGTLQKKYEEGRAPIVSQLAAINQTLQTREQQVAVWKLMKEKFVVDSMISVTRNELDDLVQQSAGGKRSAKKLIDIKEGELNNLLGKLDSYLNMPGVKQMESQLASLTQTQRRARIEQVLSNLADNITKQTTLNAQTESALNKYDAENPISANPSIQKYRQIDSLANLERHNGVILNAQIDSIDAGVKSYKDSIGMLDASAKSELSLYENELNTSIVRRNSIVAAREQVKKKAQDTRVKNNEQYAAVMNELKSVNLKIVTLEREIAIAQNQVSEIVNSIAASQQEFESMKASSSQEVRALDAQIAQKENENMEFSNQSRQYEDQIKRSEAELQQMLTAFSQSLQMLAQQISTKNGDVFRLSDQRKTLTAEIEAARKKAGTELYSLKTAVTDLQKRAGSVKTELSGLRSMRTMLVRSVQEKIAGIQKSIDFTQSEFNKYNAAYTATVQDSVNLEKNRESTYYQVKANIANQDSILAAIAYQHQGAVAEYEKARNDSISAVSGALSAVEPHKRNILALDSAITLKERELALLRTRRLQAVQDSMASASNVQSTVAQAITEIRQKKDLIASIESQSAMQVIEKKRLEVEAVTKGEQFKNACVTMSIKLSGYFSQIAFNKQKIEQLNSEFLSAENVFVQVSGSQQNTNAKTVAKSGIKSSHDAQVLIEKIYLLMDENRMNEARSLFMADLQGLKKHASPDAFEMLQASF